MNILQLMSARKFVGEAAHVLDVTEELRRLGHAVELVLRRNTPVVEEATRRGLDHHAIAFGSRFHPVRDVSDVLFLRRLIRDTAPDVVHAHRGKDHWLAAAALLTLSAGPRLFRTRHVVTPIRGHLLNRWLFGRMTDGLLCQSRAVLETVRRSAPYVRAPEMVGGGINPPRYPPLGPDDGPLFRKLHGIAPDAPLLVCLARLAPVKGQAGLLRAFALMRQSIPDAVLVFAFNRGEEFRPGLEALARDCGVAEALRWVGTLPAVGPLFAAADVSVISSIGSEGWSRVAVESGYYGVPVVSTPVGSVPEIVAHGRTGLIATSMEPPALAAAMLELLPDAPRRKTMGAHARERILASHTIGGVVRTILDCYGRVSRNRDGG